MDKSPLISGIAATWPLVGAMLFVAVVWIIIRDWTGHAIG